MRVVHNISRIEYLLELYRLSADELLQEASEGLKIPIAKEALYAEDIELNHLKRIDKVFRKGIPFYLNPAPLTPRPSASVFFRKDTFNATLNLGAKLAGEQQGRSTRQPIRAPFFV